MKTKIFFINLIFSLLLISCSSNDDNNSTASTPSEGNNGGNTTKWLIPVNEVKDGGPGKDGIPSIDNPKFIVANDVSFLADNDLVVGVTKNGEARAYPHGILDWHEIINDEISGESITINYCPLTGTAFGWKSVVNQTKSTFGVSGLLYNSNLILYDRNTDSYWSQLKLECVNGALISNKPTLIKVIETTWSTWKSLYPNTKVLSIDTGFSRNYGEYPYGSYKTNHGYFIFQPSVLNNALPNKERVHAIIGNNKSKAYRFSNFSGGKTIIDEFNGNQYLIVGNDDLICSFILPQAYAHLTFEYKLNTTEGSLFEDNEGNKWSAFGTVISGPRTGEELAASKSVISFWFAIAAFYPNPEIN